jgi:anti-anti-sigma factor
MSLRAWLEKDGDITVLHIDGKTEYQNSEKLKEKIHQLYQDHGAEDVLINLSELDFVGSSGLRNFVEVLEEVNATASKKPAICGARSEIKRLIEVFSKEKLSIFESASDALQSFRPQRDEESIKRDLS